MSTAFFNLKNFFLILIFKEIDDDFDEIDDKD